MKKFLPIAAAVALSFTAVESKAQLAAGSIAPDWTLTDINGTTHNLYTYLNAGKTVYIDVSATWCGPCWAYHNTNALEDLWTAHGPTGGTGVSGGTTNDVMVFFIEGDGSTNSADLHGTGTNTQGDWVTGVNHPIIDPATAQINSFNSAYAIGYFPTIYMICPDRSVTEVGQLSAVNLYAAKSSCAIATAAIDAEMMNSSSLNSSLMSCDSVTPSFRIGNVGTTTLTSATITLKVDGVTQKVFPWSGSVATYGNAVVTGVKVGSSVAGTHTITAEISNPNGSADPTIANNSTTADFIIFPTTGGAPVAESYEAAGIPTAWMISNGGDPATWSNATVGYSSSKSMTLNWYNIPSGDVDVVTLPPMNMTSLSSPVLTFDVAHAQYNSSYSDNLKVEVSTNCGATWSTKYNKSGSTLATTTATTSSFTPSSAAQWRHETVNLSSYATATNLLVRFKGTSAYGNNVFVDNINIASATGIEENNLVNGVNIYPNPASEMAAVDFNLVEANNVTITMVNTMGQVIVSEDMGNQSAGTHSYTLNAASLSNGLYFVNITVGNKTITRKVSINK